MATTEKIDLYKQHKQDYATPSKPVLIVVKPAVYLAIEGVGKPGGEEFQARVGALYSVAYTIKMTRKFAGLQDYAVCKLEGIWWVEGDSQDFCRVPMEQWHWKLLVRTPDFIKQADLKKAAEALKERGKSGLAGEVKLEKIAEGKCVQMLHVGPYDQEARTIEQMKALVREKGLTLHGRHHEIYLSDPRRIPPEKLKTILRIPVK